MQQDRTSSHKNTQSSQASVKNIHCFPSPLGEIFLEEYCGCLVSLRFAQFADIPPVPQQQTETKASPLQVEAERQILAYVQGRLQEFTLPLMAEGTVFQQSVWAMLQTVAYGERWSYAQVAEALGSPQSVRAVARACGQNPLLLLIPCHRICGKDGSLRGYAGELWRKQFLLDMEQGRSTEHKE